MADLCQVADGKALAAEVKSKVAGELSKLKLKHPDFQPQLSIVQVKSLILPNATKVRVRTSKVGSNNRE